MKPRNEEFIDWFGDDIIGIIEDELKKLGLNEEQVERTWKMAWGSIQDLPEIRQEIFEHLEFAKKAVELDKGQTKPYQAFFSVFVIHICRCAMVIREYPKKIEPDPVETTKFTAAVLNRIYGIVEDGT